jgi:hypothetical protein
MPSLHVVVAGLGSPMPTTRPIGLTVMRVPVALTPTTLGDCHP